MKNLTLFLAFILLFSSCKDDETKSTAPPSITSISPTTGGPDAEITIIGSDFSTTLEDNTVNFNGVNAIVTMATASKLVVKVPIGTGNGTIEVTTPQGTVTGPSFAYQPDIFIAGAEYNGTNYVAKYWKNGKVFPLTDGSHDATVSSLVVSGQDVYVVGYEFNGKVNVAKYWKNGIAVNLSDGVRNSSASAITVVGSDIYVAGSESNGSHYVAKYWKNNIATSLTNGTMDAGASDIAIKGTDVYVCGYESQENGVEIAKYWKNAIATSLTDGTRLAGTASVCVAGDDVYIMGMEDNNNSSYVYKYWKNGTIHSIPGGDKMYLNEILVVSNDIYLVGRLSKAAIYLKNGTVVNLTDNSNSAYAHGITVYNGDVYAVGNEFNGKVMVGKYWKNGVATNITDGTFYVSLWGIAVR